jgi:hypothetical protein
MLQDEEVLATHAPTYPLGGKADWSVIGDTMHLT